MVTMVCGNEGRDGDEGGFGNGAPPSSEWRREGGNRGGSGGGSEGGGKKVSQSRTNMVRHPLR